MEDLISIIVPVYNVEKYLDRCMESIVNQTYQNLEILLIDDGSTDNSGQKCDEWAKKDSRIKVIHKENGGVSSARNIGLEEATGKYIGFVDSDDYIDENMYEIMHKEIKKEKINFVICDVHIVSSNNEMNNIETNEYEFEIINKIQVLEKFYPYTGQIWRCLFIRQKLKDIKFNTAMYIAEDLNFICNYILNCEDNSMFITIRKKLYYYAIRENSATTINISKDKRLQYYIDLIEARNHVKSMIVEDYKDNKELISIIEKRTIECYWMDIYAILNEKLIMDNNLIKRYYAELKKYKQYYSKKDKLYMMLLKISPQLFESIYRKIKSIQRLLGK